MAARQAIRSFDYAAIAAKLPQQVKADFAKLVSTSSSLKESLNKLSPDAPAIDWAKYRSVISTPGVVDAAEKGASSLIFPKPEDTKSAKIAAQRLKMVERAKAEAAAAESRVKELQAKLAALHAEKPIQEMTVDEFLRDKPELRAKIDAKLKNYEWVPAPTQRQVGEAAQDPSVQVDNEAMVKVQAEAIRTL